MQQVRQEWISDAGFGSTFRDPKPIEAATYDGGAQQKSQAGLKG